MLEAIEQAIQYENRRKVAATKAASKDLRTAIERAMPKAVAQVKPVAHLFDKGNAVDTAKAVHYFCRKHFIYLADEKKNNSQNCQVLFFIIMWAIVKVSVLPLQAFCKHLITRLRLSMQVITRLQKFLHTYTRLLIQQMVLKLLQMVPAPYLTMKSSRYIVLLNPSMNYL
jgi:hypothetical protein